MLFGDLSFEFIPLETPRGWFGDGVSGSKSLLKLMLRPPKHLSKSKAPGRDFPGGPVVGTLPFNAGGTGSISGRGAKIPHASWPKTQNMEQKQYCKKFKKRL